MSTEHSEESATETKSDEVRSDNDANFEQMLDTLGHFGRFQIRIFSLYTLMDLASGPGLMYFIFANFTPPWSCLELTANTTLPNNSQQLCSYNGSKCIRFEYDLDESLSSIITEFNLVCDSAYLPQLTLSIKMVGLLFGALSCGYLSDWLGRKKVVLVFSTMMMISQIVTGFSTSWLTFTIMRVITGFFVGGSLNVCFSLPIEFVGPKWRSFCSCITLYELGTALMTLFAYLTRDWRQVAFITGSLTLPLILAILWLTPESVRWLAMKGRFDEADDIIRWMARVNKSPVPDLNILRHMAAKNLREQEKTRRYGYFDLFKTKTAAIRTCVIMYCWFTCSVIFYGISTMYSTFSGTVFVNAVASAFATLGASWVVILLANRFGRRRSFFGYMVLPCASMVIVVIIGILNKKDQLGVVMTAFVLIGKVGIFSCWDLASIYTVEIFPTVVRNLGVGSSNMASRIGGIIAPQIALLGGVSHWIVPYVIYAILIITSVLSVYFFLPETNNQPLTDAASSEPRRKQNATIHNTAIPLIQKKC
ncbi:organic cation transporter protein-like [Tubulanus polymorphus]|uniref:organic cation transporter protein-like n=1 Tax=Tubulanus polymorphus TaxID=672921 RepID=UPI003DA1FF17